MRMEPDCPFNAALDCPPGEAHNCKKCGWNPKVAQARLEKMRMEAARETRKEWLGRMEKLAGLSAKEES